MESKRSPARTFEDVIVWQKAHQLILDLYRITLQFPRHEIDGLTAQLRRAAVSIPANIAEGFVKHSSADKARFLNIAQESLEEVRYYLMLSRDLHYPYQSDCLERLSEISRLLVAYRTKLVS